MARKALGKGLEALIPARTEKGKIDGLSYVPISSIRTADVQPRKKIDSASLKELSESIKKTGILQPLVVKPVDGEPGHYELIAGERRLEGAKLAGLNEVPVIVRRASQEEALVFALIENLQREDLSSLEEALGYDTLIKKFGLTQEEVAERVGKERSTVANALRLLKLPDEIKSELEKGNLSAGHCRAILSLDSKAKMISLKERIIKKGLSVRQAEEEARKLTAETEPKKRIKEPEKRDLFIKDLEERLKRIFKTKVKIVQKRKGEGYLEIYYHSNEELERIIELVAKN